MKRRSDAEAARLLLDALDQSAEPDDALDLLLPEYVRAELAGEPAPDLFPEVHRYILTNSHAAELYTALADVESALMQGELPMPARPIQPQLPTASAQPSADALHTRILNIAQRIVQQLAPKAARYLQDYAESFFEQRPNLPAQLQLTTVAANALGLHGSDVPDEVRWLEAVYQVVVAREADPRTDIRNLASRAADNAGLEPKLRQPFVDMCANALA